MKVNKIIILVIFRQSPPENMKKPSLNASQTVSAAKIDPSIFNSIGNRCGSLENSVSLRESIQYIFKILPAEFRSHPLR